MEQIRTDRANTPTAIWKTIGLAFAFFLGEVTIRDVGAIIDFILKPSGFPFGLCIILFSLIGALLYQHLHRSSFNGFMGFKRFFLGIAIVMPSIIASGIHIYKSPSTHINPGLVFYYVAVAFFEEVAFRGIIGSQIMKMVRDARKLPKITVSMGLFFGLAHFHNILFGQAVSESFVQVISVSNIGLLYALAFIVTGSIWPTVIDHFLHNYMCSMYSDGIVTEEVSFSELAPSMAVGVVMLVVFLLITIVVTSCSNVQNHVSNLWAEKWGKGFNNIEHQNEKHDRTGILKTGGQSVFAIAVFTAVVLFLNSFSTGYISNLLGYRGYYVDSRVTGNYIIRTFYQGGRLSSSRRPIAIMSGYSDDIMHYSLDVDGDGNNELVCEGFIADSDTAYGERSVIVYKAAEGKIRVGTIPFTKLGLVKDAKDNLNIYAMYDGTMNRINLNYGTLSKEYPDDIAIDFSSVEYVDFDFSLIENKEEILHE